MPYIAGLLSGILLTILAVFIIDNVTIGDPGPETDTRKIVNWDVAADKFGRSFANLQEEVREDVQSATR